VIPAILFADASWYHPGAMLHINAMTYRIGGHTLFDAVTVAIRKGHKVGLVGRNGSGKTTLFRLIMGEAAPDGGEINLRKGMYVSTVAQEAPAGPESLIDTVLAADTERTDLLERSETATDPHEIADIHNRLVDIDAQSAPSRAARILAGLGFDEVAQASSCASLSGGWRMRVALAATLFSRPDILLLDEPTNHLDLEAALWLESHLASWQGTLVVISHDRTLLNSVVDEIIHLQGAKLNRYSGGYDRFERTRREKQELDSKLRSKQLAERRRIESFIERFRYKATKARQAQSRIKMLERMEPIASVIEDRTVAFHFPNPDPLSPPLITLEEAAIGYEEGKPVLRDLDLRIDMDDRIGLLGANGNGKSTLIKLIADRLKPLDGILRKSSKLKVGYFAQHQADELQVSESAYQHAARAMPMSTESQVRAHLGRFGFPGDKADTKTANLSGGEKARLLFALMSLEKPHIMLLDEPTNHLDVDAREALVQALSEYDGAVVLVSHDAHLIELVCDRLWLVTDGTCTPFEGDLTDYRKRLAEDRRERRRDSRSSSKGNSKRDRKAERRARAAERAETAEIRKQIRKKEELMETLHGLRADLESRLADPEVYDGPTARLMELQVELGDIKTRLVSAEEEWLALSEALEAT